MESTGARIPPLRHRISAHAWQYRSWLGARVPSDPGSPANPGGYGVVAKTAGTGADG